MSTYKSCPECNGTGQPGGVLGGPELGLCGTCHGSGTVIVGSAWSQPEGVHASPPQSAAGEGWQTVPKEPTGPVEIAHDGFAGDIIGHYTTREGKRGVVVQQHGTRVVHVYGEKWLSKDK